MTSTTTHVASLHYGQYDLATLQTWTQRPLAVTKCFVRDVYSLKALIPPGITAAEYLGRGAFVKGVWGFQTNLRCLPARSMALPDGGDCRLGGWSGEQGKDALNHWSAITLFSMPDDS